MRKLLNKLVLWLMKRAENNKRYYFIYDREGGNKAEDIYMVRYVLFKTKWLRAYIHKFKKSDEPVFHDHPWFFFTYVVTEGYKEHVLDKTFTPTVKHIKPGQFIYRGRKHKHWVEMHRGRSPITINLSGPKFHDWGFWIPLGHRYEYIPWKEYLGKEKEFTYKEEKDAKDSGNN